MVDGEVFINLVEVRKPEVDATSLLMALLSSLSAAFLSAVP